MKRLGYAEFVAQGGDWGRIITDMMATQRHSELIGIHTNMAGLIPDDIDKLARAGAPTPSGLSLDERLAYDGLAVVYGKGVGHACQMGPRPQAFCGTADPPSVLPPTFSMTMHVV